MLSPYQNLAGQQVVLMNLEQPAQKKETVHADVDQEQMVLDFTKFGHALEMNLNMHIVDEYHPNMEVQRELWGKQIVHLTNGFKNVAQTFERGAEKLPRYANELNLVSE